MNNDTKHNGRFFLLEGQQAMFIVIDEDLHLNVNVTEDEFMLWDIFFYGKVWCL